MIPMQNATTTAIITEKVTIAVIMVKGMSAGTIMERASTAATRRAMRAAAVITESK